MPELVRTYRNNGDKLILTPKPNSNHSGEWVIKDIIGEGSSAVCYSCVHLGKTGRLKEYSPLYPSADGLKTFVNAYEILDKAKSSNPNAEILNNYIPHYEVLYECNENDDILSAFIWTPDDKMGTTFENYIRNISEAPDIEPERKLLDIIRITETLADCICMIHGVGLLHLDIKPSNFLVTYNSRKEINTGNISLFDINTLYSVEADFSTIVGTEGYCAPEMSIGCPDNRADIYSLGAMLFSAIMKTGPEEYRKYTDSMYGRFESILSESKLIKGSIINSNADVINKLSAIFEKTLNTDRNKRYDYCELLQQDLKELIMLLSKTAYSEVGGKHKKSHNKTPRYVFVVIAVMIIGLSALGIYRSGLSKTADMEKPITTEPETGGTSLSATDITTETQVNVVPKSSSEDAAVNLVIMLKTAEYSYREADKYVFVSPETVGNDVIVWKDEICIPAGVTVEFSEDMNLAFDGTNALSVSGTLIMNPDRTIRQSEIKKHFISINFDYGSKYVSNGITFSFDNNDLPQYWCAGSLHYSGVGDGVFKRYFDINATMRVSASFEEMKAGGYSYFFNIGMEEKKEIYFEGGSFTYDSVELDVFETLQKQIQDIAWSYEEDPCDMYLDYPVLVKNRQELHIYDNLTLHILEGGSITVLAPQNEYELGGFIYCPENILEEGGHLIYE